MPLRYIPKTREYFEAKAGRKLTQREWEFLEYFEFVRSCGDNYGSIEDIANRYHNGSITGAKVKLAALIRKNMPVPYNIRGYQR